MVKLLFSDSCWCAKAPDPRCKMEREGSVAFVCLRWIVVCDQVSGRVRLVCWALFAGLVSVVMLSGGWGSNRAGVILIFGGAVIAVAVSMIVWSLGSGCGLKLGRQAAWRPRCKWVGVVKLVGGTVQAVAV